MRSASPEVATYVAVGVAALILYFARTRKRTSSGLIRRSSLIGEPERHVDKHNAAERAEDSTVPSLLKPERTHSYLGGDCTGETRAERRHSMLGGDHVSDEETLAAAAAAAVAAVRAGTKLDSDSDSDNEDGAGRGGKRRMSDFVAAGIMST